MRVAWKEMEKSPYLSSRRWSAKIGPCSIFLEAVDPFFDRDLWKTNHREGEDLFKYSIRIYDLSNLETDIRSEEVASGTISDTDRDYQAHKVKAKVVEIARQCERCKRPRRTLESPSPELTKLLTDLIVDIITQSYQTYRERSAYWKENHISQRLGHTNPYEEPVISVSYLLGEAEQRYINDDLWKYQKGRRRPIIESLVNKLVKQGLLKSTMAYDRYAGKDVRAYEPTT